MTPYDDRPVWLPDLDLRNATRDSAYVSTVIDVVVRHHQFRWLTLGGLSRAEVASERVQWIGAYFSEGITDHDEQSAYAVCFDVVGLALDDLHQGVTTLRAWIAGTAEAAERFHVPSTPYDLSTFAWCPSCKGDDRHRVTSYTPRPNLELWRKLRGSKVLIHLSPVIPRGEP